MSSKMTSLHTIIIWCWFVVGSVADSSIWNHCPEPTPGEVILVPMKKPEVTFLHLTECNITNIGPKSFDNIPNLQSLQLEKNNIRYLDANVFKNTKKLKEFYYLSNRVLENTSDIQLPSLERIIITHNDMFNIDFILGQGFTTLELVHCSLEAVPTTITSNFHPNLKNLVLSHNLITILDYDTLGNVANLRVLDLGYNNISKIHKEAFDSIAKVETISLRNNQIKNIPAALFQNKRSLISVNLSNNLIEYIPFDTFEGSSPSTIDLSNNMLMYLPDNFLPANFMTDETRNFDFFIDHNPWQCACLNEILVTLKRRFVNYIPVDDQEFRGQEPACVTMKMGFQCFKPEKHRNLYKKIKKGE